MTSPTDPIAAIRELLDAMNAMPSTPARYWGAATDRLVAATNAATALLAAHDARESAPAVDVRIPVGIKPNGNWLAHAWGRDPDFNTAYAHDMAKDGFTVHFITARAPLPQTIKGRVE